MTTDRHGRSRRSPTTSSGDVGVDAKYGVTANLTADLTVNTDFAQVEVDEQQVNLTRFSLFFPEKRDFFLEGPRHLRLRPRRSGRQPATQRRCTPYAVLQPAHRPQRRPRRFRSTSAAASPARSGRFSIGVLNIQTGDEAVSQTPPTNFTVLRAQARHPAPQQRRRDVHQPLRSRRSCPAHRTRPTASTRAFSFFQNVNFGGYYAPVGHRRAERATTTATRAASTTPPIATARSRST